MLDAGWKGPKIEPRADRLSSTIEHPVSSIEHPASSIEHPASSIQHRARRGVTLIELLVTMAIMAIIAAAILGTVSAAMESARRSRTQTLVNRISQLMVERLASYETRRADVHPAIVNDLDQRARTNPAFSVARGQVLADARLLAMRELVKLEMPDRYEDIELYANVNNQPLVLSRVPALTRTYLRRYTSTQAAANDSAELLFLVVMNATGDGEARTMFSEQDIGDTDEDGVHEFIDGWGEPIRWIRWPAGLVSDLQPLLPDGTRGAHDPLDPFRRDKFELADPNKEPTPMIDAYPQVRTSPTSSLTFRQVYQANIRDRLTRNYPGNQIFRKQAFRLVPLIYSSGPDGESRYRLIDDPADAPSLDPYYFTSDNYQVGEVAHADREFVIDNITNHLIEY